MERMKLYNIKKCLSIFKHVLKLYRKKKKDLPDNVRNEISETLNDLQKHIIQKNREKATESAKRGERALSLYLKKTLFERTWDFLVRLFFALMIAVAIRSLWFELYEIPTGSMRPTLKEQDRLVVSKTAFGINIPLRKGHIYFDPTLVLRNGIVIFTGADMDISNVNTRYFYLFPGKKQFVKRLIGKPGDILYFYGGKIFGIDREGNDISKELNPPFLNQIDYVPYIYMNGKVEEPRQCTGGIYAPITIRQMNLPVAELLFSGGYRPKGVLLSPFDQNDDYFDLWGFKHYGMARLLTKDQIKNYELLPDSQLKEAPLYMEVIHHPSVKRPKIIKDLMGRLIIGVGTTSSILPLTESHLRTLMDHLYTARFVVKNGRTCRYGMELSEWKEKQMCPELQGVPDGTYEFYHGKGYQVGIGGLLKELPKTHPLYIFNPERVQFFYNLGIEFLNYFAPHIKDQPLFPSRYVYYRNGDLYTMGVPLMKKDDSSLVTFLQEESLREQNASTYHPHIPFVDSGPPLLENGEIDQAFIKKHGIQVPQKMYLVLGDNYAMSGDSREFGFVPEENIRGTPDYIFWPIGSRLGPLSQAHYPFLNGPRFVIWSLAAIGFGLYFFAQRKQSRLPQKID